MAVLLNVGSVSSFVSLDTCLREVREASIAAAKEEIEARKKLNVPLDDKTNFNYIKSQINEVAQACEKADSEAIRLAVRKVSEALSSPLEIPEGYAQPDNIDNVSIRFVAMSEAQRSALSLQVALANESEGESIAAGHTQQVISQKSQAVIEAVGEYIKASVKDIDGLQEFKDGEFVSLQPFMPSTDALVKSGLLWHLYIVARHFQALPAKKAFRFGLQAV